MKGGTIADVQRELASIHSVQKREEWIEKEKVRLASKPQTVRTLNNAA